MLLINDKMTKLLYNNIVYFDRIDIDKNLDEILKLGFEKKVGGTFFHGAYTSQYKERIVSQDYIKKAYTDISGMEISLNLINIEDYVGSDTFVNSILFLKKFVERWNSLENSDFLAIISFQDDDVGIFSKFSFHKIRYGEIVYDIKNIDGFLDAVMIYVSNISAFK